MKNLLLLILFIIPSIVFSQSPTIKYNPFTDNFDFVSNGVDTTGFDGNRIITGTSFPTGQNMGTTGNIQDFLNAVFFPSTKPTAILQTSGFATSQEMTIPGGQGLNLLWSATRPLSCMPLVSTVVNGTTIVPNPNPAEGFGISNFQAATITNNTNTTYSMIITSSDGKTGTASTTVNWYWKRYFGCFTSGTAPTTGNTAWISNAQIIALSGSELSATKAKNFGSLNCSGTYYVYAFPTSFGTPTFLVNTFPTVFVQVWVNQPFTNAASGTTNYDVWVSPYAYAGIFSLIAQ